MPLHRIFHPPEVFSVEDKKAISERITAVYTHVGLPAFYCVVVFVAVDEESFFVGGKPVTRFVRVVSSHLARQTVGSEAKAAIMETFNDVFAPYVKDRGLDWEQHIEEHDRELWRENGLVPPMPNTKSEQTWVKLNKPVPY